MDSRLIGYSNPVHGHVVSGFEFHEVEQHSEHHDDAESP